MKTFIKKIFIYVGLLSVLVLLFVLLIAARPELVDNFYRRFTTPRGKSLVLGTSRSAQGIKPAVFNERLTTQNNAMINHSFAIGPSSFGPNYLREVKHKIDQETENGLFIISVDPWSLATDIDNIEDDTAKFFEVRQKLFVGNLSSSSTNPNFGYLKNYWSNRFSLFGNLFKHWINYKNLIILHDDGWLEVNVELNMPVINQRIKQSTEEYAQKKMMISNTRLEYLSKIIEFLQEKGTVVLVRMPVSVPMYELEQNRFTDFSERIAALANSHEILFYDFIDMSGRFQTVDTHHLYKKDAEVFSNILCDSISNAGIFGQGK